MCNSGGVDMDTPELVRLLALAGLVIAMAAYWMLIRRRKRNRVDAEQRFREASNARAVARFRRLSGHDDSEPPARTNG